MMKNKISIIILITLFITPTVFSQEIIYPKTTFDPVVAKVALEYGNSTIQGVLYYAPKNGYGIKNKSKMEYGSKQEISLYPMTPYIEEWYKMTNKKLYWGKKRIKMSNEANSFRISEQSDEDGNFKFTKIKPGKYVLYAQMTWVTNYGNSITGENFDNYTSKSFYEIVEIKKDGEVIKVKLTN